MRASRPDLRSRFPRRGTALHAGWVLGVTLGVTALGVTTGQAGYMPVALDAVPTATPAPVLDHRDSLHPGVAAHATARGKHAHAKTRAANHGSVAASTSPAAAKAVTP